jgi:hypothetical protein
MLSSPKLRLSANNNLALEGKNDPKREPAVRPVGASGLSARVGVSDRRDLVRYQIHNNSRAE